MTSLGLGLRNEVGYSGLLSQQMSGAEKVVEICHVSSAPQRLQPHRQKEASDALPSSASRPNSVCLCEVCRGSVANLQASKSVFRIAVKSETGETLSHATGFSVEENAIITTERAIRGGTPYLDLGAVYVRLNVAKIDALNDLAMLVPDGDISTTPLKLAHTLPRPGVSVFVLKAPTVSDHSISTGAVEALHKMRGREFLQISAASTHDTSGGPVLTANGVVVGVAVGMPGDGEGLTFAIPATAVLPLLGELDGPSVVSLLSSVRELSIKRWSEMEHSMDPDSPFQRAGVEVEGLLSRALELAHQDSPHLLAIADHALEAGSPLAVCAAKRAVDVRPTADACVRLARSLKQGLLLANGEETPPTLKQAEDAIRGAFEATSEPTAEMYAVLAEILEDRALFSAARTAFLKCYECAIASADPFATDALRGLARTCHRIQAFSDADHWFQTLADSGKATPWDWHDHAQRQEERKNFKLAAECFTRSAEADYLWKNWCRAALAYSLVEGCEDQTNHCAEACIKTGIGRFDSDGVLAHAHFLIACVGNKHRDYGTALSHAREAISFQPNEAMYHFAMSEALMGLKRFHEAIRAGGEAIGHADTGQPSMYFVRGSAYFKIEDWAAARENFARTAQLDPEDHASAYNVAICCRQMELHQDAAFWHQEALRRRSVQTGSGVPTRPSTGLD